MGSADLFEAAMHVGAQPSVPKHPSGAQCLLVSDEFSGLELGQLGQPR
jgi:hypothetical protein